MEAIQEEAAYDGRKDTVMKGSKKYANGFTPVQSHQSVAIKGHERWPNQKNGIRHRNKRSVWTTITKPYKGAHFATFPEKLIEPCVLAGAGKDGIILDPFSGAGTTGLVAYKQGRKFIGVDLNKEYCEIAKQRIEREIS